MGQQSRPAAVLPLMKKRTFSVDESICIGPMHVGRAFQSGAVTISDKRFWWFPKSSINSDVPRRLFKSFLCESISRPNPFVCPFIAASSPYRRGLINVRNNKYGFHCADPPHFLLRPFDRSMNRGQFQRAKAHRLGKILCSQKTTFN